MSLPTSYKRWEYPSAITSLPTGLRLTTCPLPFPAPTTNQLLIRVHATSLNPIDYKLAEIPFLNRFFPSKPAVPCLDFAGTVHSAGPGSSLQPGTRVFGRLSGPGRWGSLAEYVAVTDKDVARLPDKVGFVEGACLATAGLTALQSLKGVGEGSRVFVNGASGGVGTFTVQIARLLGARVTGTCSGANAQLVKDLGAHEVVDYKTQDVKEAVGKGEWDLVVDNVGTPKGLHKACDGRVKGSLVQVGAEISLSATVEMMKSAMLPVVLGGPKTSWSFIQTQQKTEDMARLAEWAAEGKLKPVVDTVFPFEDAPKAFEKLKTGRARGKIVVGSSDAS
ncbi:Zinc-binding dehydrogenase-like protein 21 [Elsinoe fawcettii]|nr:Zinc-binding dehydrogenase-like protein 21 [Elsinoe fawcettii]